jgi:hypothetical protein
LGGDWKKCQRRRRVPTRFEYLYFLHALNRDAEITRLSAENAELQRRNDNQAITIGQHQEACRRAGLDPVGGVVSCLDRLSAEVERKDKALKGIVAAIKERDSSMVHPSYRAGYNRDYATEITITIGELQDAYDALHPLLNSNPAGEGEVKP